MTLSIAHLGPTGTYSEQAALAYTSWLNQHQEQNWILCPYPSIAQTLKAVAQGTAHLAVVPVENSIEGSVTTTLDLLWQLEALQIQLALVLPIVHALLSRAQSLQELQTVYSHPQSLAQCQGWLEQFLPTVQLIPTNSNTEALHHVAQDPTAAAIASLRAASLYHIPTLAEGINDYRDNCTRFWVVSKEQLPISQLPATHTSLAFSVGANVPGALVKPLQVFAERGINLSRIESRPSKRTLGDYLFFLDLEGDAKSPIVHSALAALTAYTEVLKLFGSYGVLPIEANLKN